jgi:protein-glutamine gamma-glutamyltransferase
VRFQRIQETVLLGFAAIGLSVLALSGAIGPLAAFVAPAAFLAALVVPRRWMDSRRWQRGWTVVAVIVAGACLASAVAGAPLVQVTAQFAAYLQLHKLFNRTGSSDQEQIALLALGHVAFATILLTGLKYALLLVLFVAVAPLLLTLLHLRREIEQKYAGTPEGGRDDQTLARVLRTRRVATPGFVAVLLASAIPLLALTALFFIALPRLGFGLLAGRVGGSFLVGFSERMELGDLVPLADDPTPVLRVEFPGGAPSSAQLATLRLRGTTFDSYDGRAWRRTTWSAGPPAVVNPPAYGLEIPGGRPAVQYTVRVLQEPFEPRLLFLPAGTRAFSFRGPKPRHPGLRLSPLEWSADGTVEYREAGEEGVQFEALVGRWADGGVRTPSASAAWFPAEEGDPYLRLPPDSQRLVELARRLTDGLDDPRARADAILAWLRNNFRYTRTRHATAGSRPLESFLFDWKEGYCEYFSSAMTLLARATGLRARNVSGFLGGHWNNIGDYLTVRQSDAHSWAEVEIPGQGWLVYDATPPAEPAALSRTGGVLGWLGDLVDALRTAWHRHVIAFDVPRQIGILRALIEGLRQIKLAVVAFVRDVRSILIGLGVAVALGAALWFGRRWRRSHASRLRVRAGPGRAAPDPRVVLEARRLLGELERVLRPEGIERAVHEPAERLAERAGRHGPTLAAATEAAVLRYASARFGGRALRPPERRSLVRDVAAAVRHPGT